MDLPVEVLANITALVSPPFYPPEIYDRPSLTASRSTSTSIKSASVSRSPFTPRSISSTSEDDTEKKADEAPKLIYLPPPPHIIENLDPFPQPAYTPVNTVAAISRASHRLLEASRPWLWEHVDVRSGRGWLAIVDALTEEVVDHIEVPTESILHRHLVGLGLDQGQMAPATPLSPQGNGILLPSEPVTAAEAHAQPITVPGGYAHYVSPPGSATYPSPYSVIGNGAGSSSAGPSNLNIPYIPHDDQRYAYSPPQPPSAALLLTPPGSRGGSPQPQFRKPLPIATILQQSKMPAGLSLSPNRASDIPALGRPLSAGILENGNRFDAEFASNTESSQRPASPSLLQTPVSATGSGFGTGPGSAGPSKILQLSEAALNSLSSNTPTKSPTTATSINARLRGRSRSPRRSIGFKTEGISAVLDRSRSSSAQGLQRSASSGGSWPRRIPLERRRSSLSRHRTMSDSGLADDDDEDEEDNNADEAEDDVPDLVPTASKSTLMGKKRQRHVPFTPPSSTAAHNDLPDSDDEAMEDDHSDLLPPPGPYIRHLSFNDFRTIGSRRTQDEAVRGRFVTAGRLEGVIKNAPNLISLCMTEYVDSSLSFPVLEDILFRGYRKPRAPRRPSFAASLSRTRSISVDPNPSFSPMTTTSQLDPPRPTYVPYEDETEEERWRRRSMFTPLEALDLTGCVSGVFTSAMKEFWDTWMLNREEDESEHGRGRSRNGHRLGSASDIAASSTEDEEEGPSSGYHRTNRSTSSRRKPRFAAMRRLSLRACTTLDPPLLQDLVLAFPSLTHLDLSNTRVPSTLLAALTDAPPKTLRLQSLSLARCTRLEPSVLVEFLVQSPVVQDLVELNLYVNPTGGMAMTSNDLHRFLTAPCVKSGRLRYLDISSSGLTPAHLQPGVFPAQPSLLSLGLSYMPSLALQPIADFLFTQAPNVEILTLTGTAVESALNPSHSSLDVTLKLHAHLINPLTTVPFSLASLNLGAGGSFGPNLQPGATHLRVIELSSPVRKIIADGGTGEWKVVRSKGGRGWYVDLSAGWTPDGFVRHLPASHPRRQWLASLAKAEGRVGSSVGWHGRKMEVIRGLGMLGREGGMAGVGGYAFEE